MLNNCYKTEKEYTCIPIEKIEIDKIMEESITNHPCYVNEDNKLPRITKIKRMVKNMKSNITHEPVVLNEHILYTPLNMRKTGYIKKKYSIKKGRKQVVCSLIVGYKTVPSIIV